MTAGRRVPSRVWVHYGVSAAALGILLWLIPFRGLTRALGQVPPLVILLALAVLLAGHAVAALKWRLLQGAATELSIQTAIRAHFLGVVANLWLPGVVGGDLVRAGVVLDRLERPMAVVVASLVDRLIDCFSLIVLAAVGLIVAGAPSQGWRYFMAAVGALAVAAAIALLIVRIMKARAASKHTRMLEAVEMIVRQPGRVLVALGISLGIQTSFVLINVVLGRAVGMRAPGSAWFMAWPLAKIAALLPISAAGLGIREAAFVILMRPFGDAPEAIMASGLLWQAVFIAGGIVGWSGAWVLSAGGGAGHKPWPSSD